MTRIARSRISNGHAAPLSRYNAPLPQIMIGGPDFDMMIRINEDMMITIYDDMMIINAPLSRNNAPLPPIMIGRPDSDMMITINDEHV